MPREPTPEEKLKVWQAVRHSPMAHQAAKLGVAWSFKCAILNDGLWPHEISLNALVARKASASATAARIQAGQPLTLNGKTIGAMKPALTATALPMFDTLAVQEAQTAAEIAEHSTGSSDDAQTPS